MSVPRRTNSRKPELVEFLERVENLILEDLMKSCPDADLGRRMMRSWLDDIRWENRQRLETDVLKRITNAIDDGAATLSEIRLKTGLLAPQILHAVAKLIRDGDYFWIRQGGEPDFTKGSRPMILHTRPASHMAREQPKKILLFGFEKTNSHNQSRVPLIHQL